MSISLLDVTWTTKLQGANRAAVRHMEWRVTGPEGRSSAAMRWSEAFASHHGVASSCIECRTTMLFIDWRSPPTHTPTHTTTPLPP